MAVFSKITSKNTHNSSNGTVRKKDVVFDATVSPTFVDYSNGTEDVLFVKGGKIPFLTLLDLPVAMKPPFGDAKIKDYKLGLNITSISQSPANNLGQYKLFKMKKNMGDNEGDMTIDVSNLMAFTSYVTDNPYCDFWNEDFSQATSPDEEIADEGDVVSKKTRPFMSVVEAFECMEFGMGGKLIQSGGNREGVLGKSIGFLETVAGLTLLAVQPQTIAPYQMFTLHSDIGGRGRFFNSTAREEAKVFLKTDPNDSSYWIPAISRPTTRPATYLPPKWSKTSNKVLNRIQYHTSVSVPKNIGKTSLLMQDTNTFFDMVRSCRDVKYVSNEFGGNTDETEYANAMIKFETGHTGKSMCMDQWIHFEKQGSTTPSLKNQPDINFGLDDSSSAGQQNQDMFVMKKLPKPVRLTMDDATAGASITDADAKTALSSYYNVQMDVKYTNMEPPYQTFGGGTTHDINPYRAWCCIFSTLPPREGDTLKSFLAGHVGYKNAVNAAGVSITDLDVASGVATATFDSQNHLARVGDRFYIDASNNTYDEFVTVLTSSGNVITYATSQADVTNLTGTGYKANGPICGIIAMDRNTGVNLFSLNKVNIDYNNGPNLEFNTSHNGDTLTTDAGENNVVIPQDTWVKYNMFTDEDGPFLNSSDTSGGIFEMVVTNREDEVLHDAAFLLKDLQSNTYDTDAFRSNEHSSTSNDDHNTHGWPQYMSIWQVNVPTKCEHADASAVNHFNGDGIGTHSRGDSLICTSIDSTDANTEISSALAKNRRVRMTSHINHIKINGAGHTKYSLKQNDFVQTNGAGLITSNIPIPDIDPNFTDKLMNYNYSPCTLSLGFKNKQQLETIADADGTGTNSGFFLFNGFSTSNITDRTKIPDINIAAATTHAASIATGHKHMGQQARAEFWVDAGTTSGVDIQDTPSFSDANPVISVGYDSSNHKFAVEGFTQKGTIRFKEGSSNVLSNGGSRPWVKRENIYCSSRLTKIIDPVKGIFEVDDPKIFENDSDERYIIYEQGVEFSTSNQLDEDGNNNNNTWVAPVELLFKEGRQVGIRAFTDEDEGTEVSTFANLLTETKLSRLMISPYRYWLLINIIGNGEFPQRAYNSILAVNNFQSPGMTYNESDFYSNVDSGELEQYYYNAHSLDDIEPTTSSIELTKDYGFGDISSNKDTLSTGGYIGAATPSNIGMLLIDIPELQNVDKLEEDQTVPFLLQAGTDDTHQMRFHSSNYSTDTTKRPFLVTRFEDALPNISNFKVEPDELSDGFYPKFTWSSDADDVWYGFISVDNSNIYSQYTNAILHYPLNEEGDHTTAITAPNEEISQTATSISGTGSKVPLYDLQGLAGNAVRFDGSDDFVECNTSVSSDPTADCTTEMSVIAHCIPENASNDEQFIIAQSHSTGNKKFQINLNTSNQITARVWYGGDSDYVDVTGTSAIIKDNETPTVVILTVDTTLMAGNIKLFVNGKLEAQSGVASTSGSTTAWKIGQNINGGNSQLHIGNSASTGSNAFDGLIEEVVVYKKCIYPVEVASGEAIIKKEFSELNTASFSGGKPLVAKLFVKDYHNIRGSTNVDVCTTPQVSWRKAAFRLDTS